ncbi:leucine-rich repeat domain-containing protein [Yoonia sp. 208BN28-4]|uniref:leucine-rich repeat domain-containing protein n=1 Tax=Yoonia sp. 208BN28-4 TaxID=3126505 RepID=UPI00309A6420
MRRLFAMTFVAATLSALAACDGPSVTPPIDFEAERFAEGERLVQNCRETQCQLLDLDGADLEDFTDISDLTHVKILMVSYTGFDDLSDISALTGLTELHMRGTGVSDLSGLGAFPNLTLLHASDLDEVTDYSPIGGLSRLTELSVGAVQGNSISYLSRLSNLKTLLMEFGQIDDLSPLARMRALETLEISGMAVSGDLSPLARIPNLKQLSLYDIAYFGEGGFFDLMQPIEDALRSRGVEVSNTAAVIVC